MKHFLRSVSSKTQNGNSIAILLLLVLVNFSFSQPATFAEPQLLSLNSVVRDVAFADFNNDETPDLVAVSYSGSFNSMASIFLNDGEGNFTAGETCLTANKPYAVAAGDINQDENADFIVGHYADSIVTVYLSNGDGTFEMNDSLNVNQQKVKKLKMSDINDDQIEDICVITDTESRLVIFIGNGDGSFADPVMYLTAGNPLDLVIADFDEDGKKDIFVGNGGSTASRIHWNDGSGDFSNSTSVFSGAAEHIMTNLACMDFNHDDHLDIVSASGSYDYNTLLMHLGDGQGAFTVPDTMDPGENLLGIAAADFNGDGHPDILTSDGDNAFLINGDGSGYFAEADTLYSQDSYYPNGIYSAQLTADDKPDVVLMFNNTMMIFKNTTGGTGDESSITVSGEIIENTTWSADTVFVVDDLYIAHGATLTIEPGVLIIVSLQVPINVDGAIIAVGTEEAYIEFTAADTAGIHDYDQQTGGWGGLNYREESYQSMTSNFEYCRFKYAKSYDEEDYSDEELYERGAAVHITYANSVTFNHCVFEDNVAYHSAGAIYIGNANVEVNHCDFYRNYGYQWFAGAVYVCNQQRFDISNCYFEENKSYKGGGLYSIDVDSVFVDNCEFQYCEATRLTGGISDNYGAAIAVRRYLNYNPMYCEVTNSTVQHSRSSWGALYFQSNMTAVVKKCNISYNWASNVGAGIDTDDNVHLTIINNIFTNNEANSNVALNAKNINGMELVNNLFANNYGEDDYASSGGNGGGAVTVYDDGIPVLIANNTFVNNRHDYMGGALHLKHCSNTSLVNNIFYNNSAPRAPQIIINTKGADDPDIYHPQMSNNLIEDGLDSLGYYTAYALTEYFETYSNAYENNIDTDPRFEQMSQGIGIDYDGQDADWSLQSYSPGINTGNETISLDSLGTEVDLAGNPRIFLNGEIQVIDMGAYEFQGNPTGVNDQPDGLVSEFKLQQNYPNPFNPRTVIRYQLTVNSKVELTVYNSLGQKVETLVNGMKTSGSHQVEWNAANYASGIYFYQIKTGNIIAQKRMVLIK